MRVSAGTHYCRIVGHKLKAVSMIRHKHTDAVIPYRISYFIRYTVIEMTVYRIYGKTAENTVCRIRILEPYQRSETGDLNARAATYSYDFYCKFSFCPSLASFDSIPLNPLLSRNYHLIPS
jgi:hypothetical protein